MPDEAMGHLRQILDVPGHAVVSADGEGRITLFNEGAERLFGWTAGEMVGGAVDGLFPGGLPGAAPAARDGFQDIVGRRKDGTEFAAEVAVSRLKTDGGPALTLVLRETREDERAVFENAGIGFYRTSLDGRPLRVNRASVAMMGYDSEDVLLAAKKDVATEWYVDPGRRAEFRRLVEEDGHLADFESEVYRFRTGERIWVSETACVVRDRDGRPLYYEGTVLDITARKRAGAALHESEERFRAVVDCAPAIIHLKDAEGRFLVINKAFEDFYGAPAADTLGKTAHDLFPKAQADTYARLDRTVLETGSTLVHEVETPVGDGTLRTVRSVRFPIPGAGGEPVGIGVVAEDVTERKTAEEARRRMAAMVETSNAGFVTINAEGNIVGWNRGAQRILGHAPDGILGKSLFTLVPLEREDEARQVREAQMRGEATDGLETVRLHKNGGRVPVLLTVSPVMDEEGNVAGGTAIMIDISERKRVEQALGETTQRLTTAIESFSDGFILFDADDRFVLCNTAYRNSHPKISNLQKPGMDFETIVRNLAEVGFYGNTPGQVDNVVRTRLERHRSGQPFEYRTENGRWIRMVQYETPEGGSALV